MTARVIVPAVALAAASVLLAAPAAAAAPSCVAQIGAEERAVFGTAWGRDVVASLASDPAPLQELGFDTFGDLVAFLATSPPDACPEEE